MTPPVLEVLRALRGAGLEDRADERGRHRWYADCPVCGIDQRPLTITEAHDGDPVRIVCRSGCAEAAVLAALGLTANGDDDGADRATGRPVLRVLDMEHLLSTEPEPVPWIAEPLIARGAVTMLAGREGQGKSMLALALAAGVGHGATLAGIACHQGRVLVVDAENGEREAHRRLHGLGMKLGALVYAEADGFNLRSDLAQLEELLAEHQPDVLVLDSFRSLAPGLDENDSGPVEATLGPLRNLARRRDCGVLLLHHAAKASDGYRGSTAIGAAVELGFTLARDRDDPQARSRRKLTCWKCRLAPEPEPRWIALEAHAGRVLIGSAEPYAATTAGPSREDDLAQRLADIAAARGPLRWAELCSAAGIKPGNGTSSRARDRAIEAGTLARLAHGTYGPPPDDAQPSSQPPPIGDTGGWTITAEPGRAAA
jgi:AAA domain-containing protein